MKEAQFYINLDNNKIKCTLCPHNCIVDLNKRGVCGVRKNIKGKLVSEIYGKLCSLNFDPIEKKPLYHFFPGKIILSLGSIGCNFKCKFCQNNDISQSTIDDFPYLKEYSSDNIINIAVNQPNNTGIAFTYNEPTVWYEFMLEIAIKAKKNNLNTSMVTNGHINNKPLEELIDYMDAFNVDLKAFTNDFYKKQTSGNLEPVKETLKFIVSKNKHLEITNLIIPTLNDDPKIFEQMIKWISKELGENIVLHLSKYFPRYKMNIPETSISKLIEFYEIAKKELNYVYLGNVAYHEGNNTICNKCRETVILRKGYYTQLTGIDINGNCNNCGNKIAVT
ncbi:MAG: AmmeMemoRadiSam system radical SAM enzyme [Bacteroidales bacterium]|nr:AmmeMemoRadiSam system radical SAM enzyme [Bacteroidales bacterium]